MAEISSIKIDPNNPTEQETFKEEDNKYEKERKLSINSSKSDSFFSNLNEEIKTFLENEADISFSSNSNSESQESQININYLLDSKYWRTNKDFTTQNEIQNEKKIFPNKNNIIIVNENEKDSLKKLESKICSKKDSLIISVGSNKQTTQSNEDDDTRGEHLQNNMDTDSSNNSPLNSLSNYINDENEANSDKSPVKEERNNNSENGINKEEEKNKTNKTNSLNEKEEKKNMELNKQNNINDPFKFKSDLEFIFPYEPINYIQNQNNNYSSSFYPTGPFYNQSLFNSSYNLPSPISSSNFISFKNNSVNSPVNNCSENKGEEYNKTENNSNINGQNNKFINSNINDYNKKINHSQKELINLPLIMNQTNNQNNTINYYSSKLSLNMAYYPKIQNNNISIHKQSIDKASNSSNYLPELNNKDNTLNLNLSEKKVKNNFNNILNYEEQKTPLNNINNYNNIANNIRMKMNFKNIIPNKNLNNALNKASLKGEKQILNLDDIVSGKDTRTTVMIRNIPIKYTDEILNEALSDFHGKYDCLYMPFDYEKNGNKGYAFINFVNPLHILYFYEKFNGKKWVHFESSKICELNSAHFQGVNEIQNHAKNFKEYFEGIIIFSSLPE